MAEYPLRSTDLESNRGRVPTRMVYPTRENLVPSSAEADANAEDAQRRTPRRRGLSLVTGFLLVVVGASVIGLSPEIWRTLVNDAVSLVGAATSRISWQPIHDISRNPLDPDAFIFGQKAQALIGAAAVVGGGSVLGAGFFPALLSSALVALVAGCLMILTGFKMTPTVLIVLSLGAGYALHAPAGSRALRARGVVGTLLVLAAALCARSGWIRWEWLSSRIGGNAPEFFLTWGDLCAWGVVLAAIAVGVGIARQRRLRFLNAMVLVAVAWTCIQAGMVKTVHFPTLGESGKSIDVVDIANVPIWRWVIAGELVLLILVMLYQSRGFGMLTFAFAVTWLLGGIAISNQMATLSAAKGIGSLFGQAFATAPGRLSPPGVGPPTTGFDNMGVPNPNAEPPHATTIESSPPAAGPLPTPTTEDIRAARESAIRSASPRSAIDPAQHKLDTREQEFAETTIVAWTALMAILAGIIGAAGLAWMSRDVSYRGIVRVGLASATVVMAIWLWSRHPHVGGEGWLAWLLDWTQGSLKTKAAVFITLVSCTLFGSFALSRGSRASTWRGISIAAILLGTLASLGAVAVLIYSGGFSPLPTWTYAAIAVGQSWLAWVLLLATSREPLPPLNRMQPAVRVG